MVKHDEINIAETSSDESHKLYFSCRKNTHHQGVGFLVNKEIVNMVMSYKPIVSIDLSLFI